MKTTKELGRVIFIRLSVVVPLFFLNWSQILLYSQIHLVRSLCEKQNKTSNWSTSQLLSTWRAKYLHNSQHCQGLSWMSWTFSHINLDCSVGKKSGKNKNYGCSHSYSWKLGVCVHPRKRARSHMGDEKSTFFSHFFHFLRISQCLSHPQLLNMEWKKSKAILGGSHCPQSWPLQHALSCLGAPGIIAGTYRYSKALCLRKKFTNWFMGFHIFNFEEFFLPQSCQSRSL